MPTLRAFAFPVACFLALVPVTASAAVGMLRAPVELKALQIAQITPATGLEILGLNPGGAVGVYSTSSMHVPAPAGPPADLAQTLERLRGEMEEALKGMAGAGDAAATPQ